jgi:hypothetical protein
VLVFPISAHDVDEPMALEMNGIVGGDRGAEPQGWKHATVTPAISFTWHHTIPWNCLLAVWNGMVRGGHWKAVNEFLQLTGGSTSASSSSKCLAQNNKAAIWTIFWLRYTWGLQCPQPFHLKKRKFLLW